jgi:hypothetical protein
MLPTPFRNNFDCSIDYFDGGLIIHQSHTPVLAAQRPISLRQPWCYEAASRGPDVEILQNQPDSAFHHHQ